MKVLVTGANGLLGQKLVPLLQSKGYNVLATGKGVNRNRLANHYATMDITNTDEVMKVITDFSPDWVVNTAAMTNVDQCETDRENCKIQNVDAVAYQIAAVKAVDAKLLHLSTDFIFDGTEGPYSEEDKANPLSYYGESKADAEQLLFHSDIHWAIARTVLVYGIAPGLSRSNIILWVKSSLEQGKAINVVNDQWRTPTLAEDLALGCVLILEHDAHGIYNISGKDLLTPHQMAMATANYFKLDTSFIAEVDGSKFTQPAKRPPRTGFIIDKARTDLGYEPHSFEEGIGILASQIV
jgi:dTDP-4-dehydrorhamnose reductase